MKLFISSGVSPLGFCLRCLLLLSPGIALGTFALVVAKIPITFIICMDILLLVAVTSGVFLIFRRAQASLNTPDSEKILPQVKDMQINTFKRRMILLLRIGALPALAMAALMAHELIAPTLIPKYIMVTGKHRTYGRHSDYGEFATQDLSTQETGSKSAHRGLYDAAQAGDILYVHETSRLGLWQQVDVYRGDRFLGATQSANSDRFGITMLIGLFLVPLLSFCLSVDKPQPAWMQKSIRVRGSRSSISTSIWIATPIFETIAIILWIMLLNGNGSL